MVSVIAFGASGLGGMFTAGQAKGIVGAEAGVGNDTWFAEDAEEDKQRAKDIVELCLKQGVNMIDTSHWYGQGRSERLLGHALKGVPRKAYYINSKIGRYDQVRVPPDPSMRPRPSARRVLDEAAHTCQLHPRPAYPAPPLARTHSRCSTSRTPRRTRRSSTRSSGCSSTTLTRCRWHVDGWHHVNG